MLSDDFKEKIKFKLKIDRVFLETEIIPKIEQQESFIKKMIKFLEKTKPCIDCDLDECMNSLLCDDFLIKKIIQQAKEILDMED